MMHPSKSPPGSFKSMAAAPPLLSGSSCCSTPDSRVGQLEASLESVKKRQDQDQEATRSALAWMRREIEGLEAIRSRVSAMEAACQDMQRVSAEAKETMRNFEWKHEELWNDKEGNSRQLMSFQYELKQIAMELRNLETPRPDVAQSPVGEAQMTKLNDSVVELTCRLEDCVADHGRLARRLDQADEKVQHVGSVNTSMTRRLDEVDRLLGELRQDHLTETVALRSRIEAAAGEWDQHHANAQAMRTELDKRSVEELLMSRRLDLTEQRLAESMAAASANVTANSQELKLASLEEELKFAMRDHVSSNSALQQRIGHLEEDLREARRQSATAASSVALEPVAARVDTLEAELKLCTSKVEFDILQSKVGRLEQDAQVSLISNDAALESMRAQLGAFKDAVAAATLLASRPLDEGVTGGGAQKQDASVNRQSAEKLRAVLSRLDDAERRLQAAEDAAAEYAKAKVAGVEAAAGATVEDVAEVRNALAETCSGLARLAQDLALVREEHAVAIANVGDLTEFVAKAAASSIASAEQRFEKELAGKAAELERTAKVQREELAATASTILSQVASSAQGKREPSPTSSRGVDISSTDLFSLGASLGEKAAQLRIDVNTKIDTLSAQLREEIQTKVAAAEARIETVETSLKAELSRLGEDALKPRRLADSSPSAMDPLLASSKEEEEKHHESASQVSQVSSTAMRSITSSDSTSIRVAIVKGTQPVHEDAEARRLLSERQPLLVQAQPLSATRRESCPAQMVTPQPTTTSTLRSRLESLCLSVHQALGDNRPTTNVTQSPMPGRSFVAQPGSGMKSPRPAEESRSPVGSVRMASQLGRTRAVSPPMPKAAGSRGYRSVHEVAMAGPVPVDANSVATALRGEPPISLPSSAGNLRHDVVDSAFATAEGTCTLGGGQPVRDYKGITEIRQVSRPEGQGMRAHGNVVVSSEEGPGRLRSHGPMPVNREISPSRTRKGASISMSMSASRGSADGAMPPTMQVNGAVYPNTSLSPSRASNASSQPPTPQVAQPMIGARHGAPLTRGGAKSITVTAAGTARSALAPRTHPGTVAGYRAV